jgi:flagellar biosynthesis protein FlhG
MVVVTPEATSMTDAYSLIKVLFRNHYTGQVNIVVNMAETLRQGKTVYHRLASVTSQFLQGRVFCAAILLLDERVRQAVANRRPLVLTHPTCPVVQALSVLAVRVGRSQRQHRTPPPLLRKVVNWFS